MALQTMWQGVAGQLLSKIGALVDGSSVNVTTDAYGRPMVVPLTISDYGAAIEGSYYTATAGVAGSAAAIPVGPASSVPADTTPFVLIMNTNTLGGPSLYIKRIYCLLSGAQTSETNLTIQGQLDQGLLFTSGGTKLTVQNVNPLGRPSQAVCYHGSPGKSAKTGAVIYCARSNPRSTIPVIGDEYLWKFGASEGPSSFISSTAGATRQIIDVGAVTVPPQWTFSLHAAFGATSTGAPAVETEIGFIER